MTDFVYFMRPLGQIGPIKIGVTGNISHRRTDLQGSLPWTLEVLASMPGDFRLERRFHAKFLHLHLRHEWFEPSDDLTATIAAINDGTFDPASLPEPRSVIEPQRRFKAPFITTRYDDGTVRKAKLMVVAIELERPAQADAA